MEVPVARVPSRPTCSRPPFGHAARPAPAPPAAPRAPLSAPPPAGRGGGAGGAAGAGGRGGRGGREVRSAEARRRGDPDELLPTAILVTGYPPYTKPQDLAHAFCKFGSVRLNNDWITDSAACLEFTDPEHALAAIRASRQVNVYGAFLTVRPCTVNTRPQRQPRRREPRVGQRNNFKGTIVEPGKIPLQGPFHQQLDALLCAVRLTQAEIDRLAVLYRDLEYVLSEIWPGCRAIPFGSVTTGLGVKSSDADCFVALPGVGMGAGVGAGVGAGAAAYSGAGAVARARRALHAHPHVFGELLAIPRANTPIVKFLHLPTRVYCDLSFKTPLGSQNSKLIAFLLFIDPRLIPVAVVVKYWARVHDLTGTGKLTNYALTMLVIFYFQQATVAILPPVEWLQRDRGYDCFVDYWNTGFMNDPRLVRRSTNTSSIAELLGGFFEFYAKFDFEQFCVCPFLGRAVKKDDFRDLKLLPEEFIRYKTNVSSGATLPMRFMTSMCVQDPLEQSHNVASPVSSRLSADICAFFKFAADAYEKEKLKDFSGLLTTILLEKPNLPSTKKGSSEFRARLPPGLVANIAAPDWQAVVRDVVLQVFQTILRVKLTKVEKELPEAGRSEKDVPKAGKSTKTEEISPGSPQPGKPNAEESGTGKIAKSEYSPKPRRKEVSKRGNETATSEETAKSKQETAKPEESPRPAIEKAKPEEATKEEEKERASPEKGKLIKRGKVVQPGCKTTKEKEKYMGVITKAIWKRKLFSKLYSVMGLKLLDRETMITDEIMKVDKNVLDLKFLVLFTYSSAPSKAAVSIRHVSGELNCFKEFGKFINSIFPYWFAVLYKPYCKNTKNPVVGQKALPAVSDEEAAAKELNEAMKRDVEDKSDSDSDSDLSYEDERIDPSAEVNTEVFERVDSAKQQKIYKNNSNSAVKKHGESDKAKKCDRNEIDSKVVLSDQKRDKDEVSSDKTPQKGKNKQHSDKNKDSVAIDHLNDGVESLNLSEKSPRKNNKVRDKNRQPDIGDQNYPLNASDRSPQNTNNGRHGDVKTNREIDKSKTRHRNKKNLSKTQISNTETGDKTREENGEMP